MENDKIEPKVIVALRHYFKAKYLLARFENTLILLTILRAPLGPMAIRDLQKNEFEIRAEPV